MSRMKFFALLLFSAAVLLSNGTTARNIASEESEGVKVVVIDPGHGGKFPGAHYAGVREKDLALAVALRLGKLIEAGMPSVKVVYTRKTDKHLDEDLVKDLQARANIANKNQGNLFLSIHVNAARTAAAKGVETLIMGETPKEQRYNEEALIASNREEYVDLVDDEEGTAAMKRAYIQNMQFSYGQYSMAFARCIQDNYKKSERHVRKIKPQLLRVLYATNMPCALTEIGFMSNPQEAAYMKSEKGQNEIARTLYNAVKEYSDRILAIRRAEEEIGAVPAAPTPGVKRKVAEYQGQETGERGVDKQAVSAQNPVKQAAVAPKPSGRVRYTVQLLAGAKKIPHTSPEFRSYKGKVKRYTGGGSACYKYCVGEFADRAAAQKKLAEVHKQFPGAFVVPCREGRIVEEKR